MSFENLQKFKVAKNGNVFNLGMTLVASFLEVSHWSKDVLSLTVCEIFVIYEKSPKSKMAAKHENLWKFGIDIQSHTMAFKIMLSIKIHVAFAT